MHLAVYGILADGVGSGAGVFPVLLRALLERGHRVDCFGTPGYTQPRSLEDFPGYRFIPLHIQSLRRTRHLLRALPTDYPKALEAQLDHLLYHRLAVRRVEEEHRTTPYDGILCTDAQALAPSKLLLMCWPQSPPHTEAAALRAPDVAKSALARMGAGRYAAVLLFYAYRWLMARSAINVSDVYLCGSRWAHDEWQSFGAASERLRTLAYPIDLEAFAEIPPLGGETTRRVTFLWLGRATPRKRLDLFLSGFAELHRREPDVRARLVGRLAEEPSVARVLDAYRGHPAISIEAAVPRARVPDLFAEIDVLVQPSQNENFGFSVAEALAAGRAVVLGPTNGTADFVGDAGFVFDRYEPKSVAAAMQRALLATRTRGAALSEHARRSAREHFAIDAVADRFLAIWSEALARRAQKV